MKPFARVCMTVGLVLALSVAAHAAYAIEYSDVLGLTKQGVSDRTIVELIVKDGRAFEMSTDERNRLRDAGVSDIVIRAMDDPSVGQKWLDGDDSAPEVGGDNGDNGDNGSDNGDSYDGSTTEGGETGNGAPVEDEDGIAPEGGYSSSLDGAYDATPLVYSFGYYYGPLSRYYYCDPFYYSFWDRGYRSSYWPSYYAYYWRPRYDWCYAYPYNYYNYNSFYCFSYFDPGYYVHSGYHVLPGYHRSVWNNGPRWRNGGLPPAGGGTHARVLNGRFAESGGLGIGRPSAPPVIQQAIAARQPLRGRGSVGMPVERTPVRGAGGLGSIGAVNRGGRVDGGATVGRGPVVDRGTGTGERPRRMSGFGDFLRQPAPRSQPVDRGQGQVIRGSDGIPRVYRGGWGARGTRGTYGNGGAARGTYGGGARGGGQAAHPESSHGSNGGGHSRGGGGGGNRGSGRSSGGGDHSAARSGDGGGRERSR